MPLDFHISKPSHFDLQTAVCGHGWYDLPPLEWDPAVQSLTIVLRGGNRATAATLTDGGSKINVRMKDARFRRERAEREIRHILRLDDDMSEFYAIAEKVQETRWAKTIGAGRLLRSATVYEDIVKTLCTTNCSWSLTRKMVENLVGKLGEPAGDGRKAFPTPEAMASVDEAFYRNEIKAGYRSPYFLQLASQVHARELDPESLLASPLPTAELRKEIKKIKGFGDYAADNLLKLLGRFDYLALDSWLRARFYKKHNHGKPCPDAKIEKYYSKFGKWKGLMIWCDMTEDWFENR